MAKKTVTAKVSALRAGAKAGRQPGVAAKRLSEGSKSAIRNPQSAIVTARRAEPKIAKRGAGAGPARVKEIMARLDRMYPKAECALVHENAWQLLVATILSAQCTDERVNKVTPGLFQKYPAVEDLAATKPEVLEPDIRSTGFFRNKAKSITGAARKVVSDFGGKVPQTMEELLTLPGVARKTANVVLGVAFKKATGVVVDTHVHRVSRRLDLTKQEAPQKIEQDLMKVIPQDRWISFSHQVIWHGRQRCVARKPRCSICELDPICYAPDKTVGSRQ